MSELSAAATKLRQELARVVVGQTEAIDLILVSLLTGGHSLLVGVPGLAKTLIVRSFAAALDCQFSRIQFTPDLMPSDITGTEILTTDPATGQREFRFVRGPIFTNILLADEINRAPPKTQSALLEAMAERGVTVSGRRHSLDEPFFVLATQNPFEQEGTYRLPEAQLDRFMFVVPLDYPPPDDELQMLLQTTGESSAAIVPQLHAADIMEYRQQVRSIPVARSLAAIALNLVQLTRPAEGHPLEAVNRYVSWGAGPRAGQFLLLAAKAAAGLRGNPLIDEADLFRFARPVLQHRIKTNYAAAADGVDAAYILDQIEEHVRRQLQSSSPAGLAKLLRT